MEAEFNEVDEVYPGLSREEFIGYLSPEEAARMYEKAFIPFRVTVTTAAGTWHTTLWEKNACMAVIRAAGVFISKPKSIKIKVEPISASEFGSEG